MLVSEIIICYCPGPGSISVHIILKWSMTHQQLQQVMMILTVVMIILRSDWCSQQEFICTLEKTNIATKVDNVWWNWKWGSKCGPNTKQTPFVKVKSYFIHLLPSHDMRTLQTTKSKSLKRPSKYFVDCSNHQQQFRTVADELLHLINNNKTVVTKSRSWILRIIVLSHTELLQWFIAAMFQCRSARCD